MLLQVKISNTLMIIFTTELVFEMLEPTSVSTSFAIRSLLRVLLLCIEINRNIRPQAAPSVVFVNKIEHTLLHKVLDLMEL